MDINGFNREYKVLRASLRAGQNSDVDAAQRQLRELASGLQADRDRKVADKLIEGLPALLADTPQAPTSEMTEALEILNTADFETGTDEHRLAAIDLARKQIWAIADRAGEDGAAIRGLTRMLDRAEESLTESLPWSDPPPSSAADS